MRSVLFLAFFTGCSAFKPGGTDDTGGEPGYDISSRPSELPVDEGGGVGSVLFEVTATNEKMDVLVHQWEEWNDPDALDAVLWTLPANVGDWKSAQLKWVARDALGAQIGFGSYNVDVPFVWERMDCEVMPGYYSWEASCSYVACGDAADPADGIDCAGETVSTGLF